MKMNFVVKVRPTTPMKRVTRWDAIQQKLRKRLVIDHWIIEKTGCVVTIIDPHTMLVEVEGEQDKMNYLKDAIILTLLRYFDNNIECDSDIEVGLVV